MKKPEHIKEFRYIGIPRQAIHLYWNDIDDIASELMTRLLEREITIEVERSDFYNWEITIISSEPISKMELEMLYAIVEANEDEKEKNVLEDGFISALNQGLSCSLISLLLPFEAVISHADDNGIWFISEYIKHQTLEKPIFPEKMPVGKKLYEVIINGINYERYIFEGEMRRKGVDKLLNKICEAGIIQEISNFLTDEISNYFHLKDDLRLLRIIYRLTMNEAFFDSITEWALKSDSADMSTYRATEELIRNFCEAQLINNS